MRWAILLPPSKGQQSGGGGQPWDVADGGPLGDGRERVTVALVAAMRRQSHERLSKLLDAHGNTLVAAMETNCSIRTSPTAPAIARYSGVLYKELDYPSLPTAARRRLDRSVQIFGALHGVAAAREPIPEYRLGFGASLGPLGTMGRWWRPQITSALDERLPGATVWDLLTAETSAAWNPGDIAMKHRYVVRFVDVRGRTVSHWNKLLKGALVRHLARHGLGDPAVLETFAHPSGYRWDPDATVREGIVTTLTVRATDRS